MAQRALGTWVRAAALQVLIAGQAITLTLIRLPGQDLSPCQSQLNVNQLAQRATDAILLIVRPKNMLPYGRLAIVQTSGKFVMQERELRTLIEEVRVGKLPRRTFITQMVSLGLTAPMAAQMLMHSGVASAQAPVPYKPTKRGGGGALKVLWWQGATLLQPHFAQGTKDQEGSRIFYESLAVWDNDGNLVPILAEDIPTRANGGLSADGKSVTWKLKKGVTWHDGKPFTADDCVFTWEYAKDPATAAVTTGVYKDVKVDKVDSHTIRVTFAKPTPFWATAFVAAEGMIIPKHLFAPYIGAKSREAPTNLKPVGTGLTSLLISNRATSCAAKST